MQAEHSTSESAPTHEALSLWEGDFPTTEPFSPIFLPSLRSLQRLPLFYHQLVRDVVLVDVADVLDGHRPHILGNEQFDILKPFIRIESLCRRSLAQHRNAIWARIVSGKGK